MYAMVDRDDESALKNRAILFGQNDRLYIALLQLGTYDLAGNHRLAGAAYSELLLLSVTGGRAVYLSTVVDPSPAARCLFSCIPE